MTSPHYCFCELAPLYVLGRLSDVERLWVEQQLMKYPELAEELAMIEESVSALAYITPLLTPSQDLKQRLFQQIGVEAPESSSTPSTDLIEPVFRMETSHRTETPEFSEQAPSAALLDVLSGLNWQPKVPGIMVATLQINHHTRQAVFLLKAEAGAQYPLHYHTDVEEIFMLAGDLIDGDRTYRAGEYLRSTSGSAHGPRTTEGCVFLARTSLDDQLLELNH